MFSPAPVYPALDEVMLADALQESLEQLGPSDPFNVAVLKGRTPAAVAKEAIGGTKLADPAARKALVAAGARRRRRLDRPARRARARAPIGFARKNQKMLDDRSRASRRKQAKKSAARDSPCTAIPPIRTRRSRCGSRTGRSRAIR